jgi:hypothetical protein
MTDIIDLIERMGQDSALRYASRPVLDKVMSEAQLSPESRTALTSGDRELLESLLGAAGNVCCIVEAPLTEEDDDAKPRKADDDKSKDSESVSKLLVALASRDRGLLENLLGATGNVCCVVHAPLTEEDEDEKPRKTNTNVCCLVHAPITEEDEEEMPQKADELPLSRVA